METLSIGWPLVWKPVAHFVSSGLLGLLVYWLTSTTLTRSLSRSGSTPRLRIAGFSIRSFSLALACSFAVLLHIWEDYTFNVF